MARLNVQGLARRDPGLMKSILSPPGYTTVSIDLASGEPTVTTHYSQDRNYKMACFDMVGKAPYYENGILQIDDIYLQTASVSPIGRKAVDTLWQQDWSGKTFPQQWLEDPEVIKKAYKDGRAFHKILCLGLSYGMGSQKMVNSAYEKGYALDLDTAKKFKRVYWDLYEGVKQFVEFCGDMRKRDGCIINEFGYRGICEPHKSFNFWIQSSVSGILHVFTRLLMHELPQGCRYITCVHDELLIAVPDELLQEAFQAKERATQQLNDTLDWSVNIRTGWVPGKTWYEAK